MKALKIKTLKIKIHDIHVFLNSLIIAVLCTSNLLFIQILYILNITQGFFLVMGAATGLLLFSLAIYRNLSKTDFFAVGFLLCLIMFFYFICNIFNRIGNISFFSFAGYCILPIVCALLKKNTKTILECILIISLFTLPVSNQMFEYQYVTLQQTDMSKAYAVFVTVSAAAIHFFRYRKKSNIIIKICYIVNVYLLYKLLQVGNRGVIASVIFLILVLLICYIRNNEISAKKKRAMMIFLVITGIVLVVLVLNIERIIVYLYNYFYSSGRTVPSFIIKMYKLIVYKSDITNGRDEVYGFFISKILSSPIIGYGMEMSSSVSGGIYPYPHNFILQMLFEGGILFAAYPTYLGVRMLIDSLFVSHTDRDYEIFAVFLLCNCIPKLLVSGSIWNQTIFWMWLGLASVHFMRQRRRNGKIAK